MPRIRLALYVILLGALILPAIQPANAASISGTKCTRVSSTKIIGTLKFTCVKSGKKLLWNKGTTVKVAPNPIATPTPKPTPSTTINPWVPPAAPTGWNDLVIKAAGISYSAWKKTAEKISISNTKLGEIAISKSPNAVPDNPNPLLAMNLVSRFSANYKEPKNVQLIYADEKDIDWGQKQIDDFCAPRVCGYDVTGEAKKACNVPVTPCWGGLALRNHQTNIPMIYVTTSQWGKTDPDHSQGTLEAHEYFHNVQSEILAPAGWDKVPRWLVEGGATWVGEATVFYEDFNKYLMRRNSNNVTTLVRNKPNAAWLEKFLDPNYQTGWDQWNGDEYDHWAIYDVGSLATEIMVSIGGPDSFLDLYKLVGSGKTFAQAFESIYGISWKEGARLIAEAIVAQQK